MNLLNAPGFRQTFTHLLAFIILFFLFSCNVLLSEDKPDSTSNVQTTSESDNNKEEAESDSIPELAATADSKNQKTNENPNNSINPSTSANSNTNNFESPISGEPPVNEIADSTSSDSINTEKGVGTSAVADGSAQRIKERGVDECFWGNPGKLGNTPLVKIQHAIGADVCDFALIFNPNFVDNTYGANAIGFRKRSFKQVDKSDHVEVALKDKNGQVVFHAKIDLLSATSKVSTGYATLGPFGGDGVILVGHKEDVVSFGTSMDDNFNHFGYPLKTSSPKTDENYTPNPNYPNWEYKVAYRITIKSEVFGAAGYGSAHMTSVHASPAKNGNETIEVTKNECPEIGEDDPFVTTVEKKHHWVEEKGY